MKKLSLAFVLAVAALLSLGASPAFATNGDDAVYYATCPIGGPGCPNATTLYFNGSLDKTTYAPGDPIYLTVQISSDDNPQLTTGVSPVAYGTVPGGAESADLFPGTYTPQQIRSTVTSSATLIGNAPSTPGSYSVSTSYSSGGYGHVSDTIPFTVVAPTNGASCGSISAPANVSTGQSFSASISMNNTGGTTWTSASNYKLGSQSAQDNTTWGTNRVALPSSVAPNGSVTFTNTFTAPSTAGSYTFAWEMVQDGVAWFGATCSQSITVSAAASAPTVTTTNPATSIMQTSATDGGTIVSNGGATVSISGIVWGTSANPTTGSHLGMTTDGWAVGGPWTDGITGLSAGTTYHVRAYATNSVGTSYGADVPFTTSSPASCTGQTINNCVLPTTSSGSSAGSCASGYTGSCNYSCSNGTWTQNTNSCTPTASAPTVTTTNPATSIMQTSATDGGTIVSNGGATVSISGIVWGTSANPTTGSHLGMTTDGWAVGGPWTDGITGLSAGTTYHVRAYATNSVGTSYGADVPFTTSSPASCTGQTINNCVLPTTSSGSSAGSCASGYTGSCNYSCSNGTWTQNTNSCIFGSGSSGPDLIAGDISPTSATAGTPATLQATITNQGDATTGSSFQNFIQVATAANGGGTITDLTSVTMSTLAASGNAPTQQSYTFPSSGTYSARACADKSNRNDTGTITESNENNNCGNWTAITVAASGNPVPTATLGANPTSINPGSSSSLTWSSTNATSCTFADIGAVATSGTRSVSPSITSTYSITCSGAGGTSAPAMTTVTVLNPALSITATPSRVKNGSTSTIAWTASNVKSCSITKNGAAWKSGNGHGAGSSYSGSSLETITVQTAYVMTCKDVNGTTYPTPATVIVNLAPAFQEF